MNKNSHQPKSRAWTGRWMLRAGAVALAATLAACGSDGGSDSAAESSAPPPTKTEAARFLAQATYGPTEASINALSQSSYSAWLNDQFARTQLTHRVYVDKKASDLAAAGGALSQTNFRESYWAQALTGPDQLRQRAAYALSQIFVISFVDGTLANQTRGVTSYYDMLGEKAFGNYRDLLESVSLHPMMGVYLTSLRNQKEDTASGRVPDENYAREVMQLFSIGLYELNNDGTTRGSTPTETYTHEDIQGLAKVFTGFSWYAGPNLADRTDTRFFGGNAHPDRDFRPMQAYSKYHSSSEKRFLGTVIPAATATATSTEAELKTALDTLFNHPNVGPFIGKQLIQRMVTSNPSPAYVGRVAAAFNNNGSGVRGDMKAVFRAVLLDSEARADNSASNTYGKVREPVLRLSHFLRAFKASSTSGDFTGLDNTDAGNNSLSQTAMRSPTVFNFYRPGYTPPNSAAANAGLVGPELALANEVSVAGYLNFMRGWLVATQTRDIVVDFSAEITLADNAGALVDRLNLLLMSGQMSSALRTQILAAIGGRPIPAATASNQAAVNDAKRDRAFIGIFLTMASPEYMIQK
ncbi:MAG TPA: DUF1800 domain-containing protein [Rhizobacter sp.]|nr:DUF1800 domain-containing protein [Rhizobacter sp.]